MGTRMMDPLLITDTSQQKYFFMLQNLLLKVVTQTLERRTVSDNQFAYTSLPPQMPPPLTLFSFYSVLYNNNYAVGDCIKFKVKHDH